MTESEAIKRIKECRNTPNFQAYIYMNEALNMAMQALEKQISRKPDFTEDKKFALCPCCNGKGLLDKQKYCDNCGQKLDWSDSD